MLFVLIFCFVASSWNSELDFGCDFVVSGSEPQPFQVKAGEVPLPSFPWRSVISEMKSFAGRDTDCAYLWRSWRATWLHVAFKSWMSQSTEREVFSQGCTSPWREALQLIPRVTQVVFNCLQRSQRSSHLKDLSWEVQWHRAQRSDQKGTAKWILVASCCNDSQIIQDARCDRWYALICVDHDSCM